MYVYLESLQFPFRIHVFQCGVYTLQWTQPGPKCMIYHRSLYQRKNKYIHQNCFHFHWMCESSPTINKNWKRRQSSWNWTRNTEKQTKNGKKRKENNQPKEWAHVHTQLKYFIIGTKHSCTWTRIRTQRRKQTSTQSKLKQTMQKERKREREPKKKSANGKWCEHTTLNKPPNFFESAINRDCNDKFSAMRHAYAMHTHIHPNISNTLAYMNKCLFLPCKHTHAMCADFFVKFQCKCICLFVCLLAWIYFICHVIV